MDSQAKKLPKGFGALLLIAMILAALNLRPAVTSLGALLNPVIDDLSMNGFIAGIITGVPPLCFAVLGPLAPKLAGKRGPEVVIVAAMLAILIGLGLRAVAPNTWVFFFFTALALAGIAIGNILMPVLVKRWFPTKIGLVTGSYTTAVAVGASVVAAIAVPVNEAVGGLWRTGLAVWAIPALIATIIWCVVYFGLRNQSTVQQQPERSLDTQIPELGSMMRNSTAWWVALFFGAQATVAYILMGWAPKIFTDFGVDPTYAGVLLGVILGVGVPLSFVMPALAGKFAHQGPLVIINGAAGLIAIAGLLIAPVQGALLWAILLGICGSNFPLALTMIGLKAHTAAGVSKLSTFGQSMGYLIAIPGPFLVGALHETTNSWTMPIVLIALLMLFQTFTGYMAGRPQVVEGESQPVRIDG